MAALAKVERKDAGSLLKKGHKKMDEKKVGEAIKAMKNQIAIIQKIPEYLGLKEKTDKQIEERQTAIEALQKQLPKKVEYEGGYIDNGFTKYRMAKCPNCDRWHSSRDEIIYCSKCGQKLDWSKEDEQRNPF